MEIQVYNPYTSSTLAERLLNRRPASTRNTTSTWSTSLQSDRNLHRRQNRFRNLNRFGEQSEYFFDGDNVFFYDIFHTIKTNAAVKIQRWYKRYNINKKYIKKQLNFIDR